MKTACLILAASSALAAHMLVRAEPSRSLNDARLAIIKGTAPGIVLIGPGRSASAAAVAASSASAAGAATQGTGQKAAAPAPAPAPAPAAGSTPLAERLGPLLKWGDPPSGQPLSAARRLDSPTQGIALPTSGSAASQPAPKGPPKPGG